MGQTMTEKWNAERQRDKRLVVRGRKRVWEGVVEIERKEGVEGERNTMDGGWEVLITHFFRFAKSNE